MKKLTTEEFIEKAKKVHGNKYDYSEVNYKSTKDKVKIICRSHGEFLQTAGDHLKGCDCPKCSVRKVTINEFIDKSNKIHNNKYDYSKVNFTKTSEKVIINCPIHGGFIQDAHSHLLGKGCPMCSKNKKLEQDDFIKKVSKLHNYRYNYSKTIYKNIRSSIKIICPIHGEFEQIAAVHLYDKCGCPKCNYKLSNLELNIRSVLLSNSINFEEQKTWDWLIYKSNQHVDFYLPSYNIAIECQGIQHFKEIKFFKNYSLEERQLMDKNKLDLCTQHGIKVIYYSNLGKDFEYPYEVITDFQVLIDEIKKIDPTSQSN